MADAPDLRTVTAQDFAPHVGSVFTVVAGEERRELRLERVEERPDLVEGATHPDGTPIYERVPFTLVLSGPGGELFGQATFEVRHASLGTLPLFIKPFAEHDGRVWYESIFA